MPGQQKLILVNGSRLLRSILKRAIEQDKALKVVAEVDDFVKFPAVLQHTDADWVILTLNPHKSPPEIVDKALREQPKLSCLILATDGSCIRMRWVETHEISLDKKSLEELQAILRENRVKERLSERIGYSWIAG